MPAQPTPGSAPANTTYIDTTYPVLRSGQIGAFAWRGGRQSIPLITLLESVTTDVSSLRQRALTLSPLHSVNNSLLGPLSAVWLAAIRLQALRTRLG